VPSQPRLLRATDRSVTTVELFFDLVYVFAVTQLSHLLVVHTTTEGAVQAAVLLAMVWQVWVYTTWAANYLDPNHDAVRAMLLVLMLGSLVLSAALPEAFTSRGLVVAACYVAMQVGRCLFAVIALRGDALQMVFVRILPWSTVTGAIVLVGAFEHGNVRAGLWALSVALDLFAAGIGFRVPGLGRSATSEWVIDGGHFAERCQAFVLIALGESIVVIGSTLAGLDGPGTVEIAAFVAAFAGSVGLWWIYFDRAAQDSARVIEESDDPGRLGRNAFHWIHPVIVGGVIVAAAADQVVLADPSRPGAMATAWLLLGGVGLYLLGHALFKAVVWQVVPWTRLAGVVVLIALFAVAPHVSALVLSLAALAVVLGVAVADRRLHPAGHTQRSGTAQAAVPPGSR